MPKKSLQRPGESCGEPGSISSGGESELLTEVDFYTQVRKALGQRFQAAVEAATFRVARRPLGGAPSFEGTRSVLIKDFLFGVVYRIAGEEMIASAPHRKRPLYWAGRSDRQGVLGRSGVFLPTLPPCKH